MDRCSNCGKPVHRASFRQPDGSMSEPIWMHTIVDGGDADCHLTAVVGPRQHITLAVPQGLSWAERDEFIGRLENAADAIADSMREAHREQTASLLP